MKSIFPLIVALCFGHQFSTGELSSVSTGTELVMYQHRAKILYNQMKAEGCLLPGDIPLTRREILTERNYEQLKVEKAFYDELTDLLITCRKAKFKTQTAMPTSTPRPVTTRTVTQTQTTEVTALTTTVTASTTTSESVQCPKGYILNPVSSTCLRLVGRNMTWPTAKSTCESAGEYLAVFETHESVQWLLGFMGNSTTPAAWKEDFIWIGLHYTEGLWRWTGRVSTILPVDDASWDTGEPLNGETSPYGGVRYDLKGIHDCYPPWTKYAICEQRKK